MSEEIKWREVTRSEYSSDKGGTARWETVYIKGQPHDRFYLPEEPKRKSLVERFQAKVGVLTFTQEAIAEMVESYIDERLAELKK